MLKVRKLDIQVSEMSFDYVIINYVIFCVAVLFSHKFTKDSEYFLLTKVCGCALSPSNSPFSHNTHDAVVKMMSY